MEHTTQSETENKINSQSWSKNSCNFLDEATADIHHKTNDIVSHKFRPFPGESIRHLLTEHYPLIQQLAPGYGETQR